MIEISVNNEKKILKATTVAILLGECGFTAEKVAVAINAEFVPRSQYASHQLKNGDLVDVLSAVQGG